MLLNSAFCQAPPAKPATKEQSSQRPANENRIALDTSETLFSVLTAINLCGYDYDLASSDPIRGQIRTDVASAIKQSEEAASARSELCRFYKDKQQADAAHELAQYVSLALNLSPPPQFSAAARASDLPPDAFNILGFVPLLQKFYDTAGLHQIWLKYQPAYERELQRLHGPVAQMILNTGTYLKLPVSSYLGRKFVVYVEPMGPPGQVNARNYGADYFLTVSPSTGSLRQDQIRHTYLHYILDPPIAKRGRDIKKMEPLLAYVQTAPLDDSFKQDIGLLTTESLIRAIEARNLTPSGLQKGDNKALEAARNAAAQASMEQGYVLTRYFYDQLVPFERESTGFRDALSDWLFQMNLASEKKRANETTFAAQATPDPLRQASNRKTQLDLAEVRLSERDAEGAHHIAQRVLDDQSDDPARAMFILAKAATLNKDIDEARLLFERTLQIAKEPRTVAWSHILLARILDLMCDRDSAVSHYRAALSAGDRAPDTLTAANRGIQQTVPGCDKSDSDKSN